MAFLGTLVSGKDYLPFAEPILEALEYVGKTSSESKTLIYIGKGEGTYSRDDEELITQKKRQPSDDPYGRRARRKEIPLGEDPSVNCATEWRYLQGCVLIKSGPVTLCHEAV